MEEQIENHVISLLRDDDPKPYRYIRNKVSTLTDLDEHVVGNHLGRLRAESKIVSANGNTGPWYGEEKIILGERFRRRLRTWIQIQKEDTNWHAVIGYVITTLAVFATFFAN